MSTPSLSLREVVQTAKNIVWNAKKDGTLKALTPRIVRQTVEKQMDLQAGTLDPPGYRSVIKEATAFAVRQDPPAEHDAKPKVDIDVDVDESPTKTVPKTNLGKSSTDGVAASSSTSTQRKRESDGTTKAEKKVDDSHGTASGSAATRSPKKKMKKATDKATPQTKPKTKLRVVVDDTDDEDEDEDEQEEEEEESANMRNLRIMWHQLAAERRKVDKLIGLIGLPHIPKGLLDSTNSLNIHFTSPTSTLRDPPPLLMNMHTRHTFNSPYLSPTAADFLPEIGLDSTIHILSREEKRRLTPRMDTSLDNLDRDDIAGAITRTVPTVPFILPYDAGLESSESASTSGAGSVYSHASSRTKSTDYGVFYTRRALSQETLSDIMAGSI